MKLYLLDREAKTVETWKTYFDGIEDVEAVCDDLKHFMDTHEVECVVAHSNSYGLMDEGYDLAISDWFGWDLMNRVQDHILKTYRGEQPAGSSFIIETKVNGIKLIHTPTMRIPSVIKDPMVIYQCMRTCLMTALDNRIKSIVIPAFGGGCGNDSGEVLCRMMYEGYMQVMNPPDELSWKYAERWKPEDQYN